MLSHRRTSVTSAEPDGVNVTMTDLMPIRHSIVIFLFSIYGTNLDLPRAVLSLIFDLLSEISSDWLLPDCSYPRSSFLQEMIK